MQAKLLRTAILSKSYLGAVAGGADNVSPNRKISPPVSVGGQSGSAAGGSAAGSANINNVGGAMALDSAVFKMVYALCLRVLPPALLASARFDGDMVSLENESGVVGAVSNPNDLPRVLHFVLSMLDLAGVNTEQTWFEQRGAFEADFLHQFRAFCAGAGAGNGNGVTPEDGDASVEEPFKVSLEHFNKLVAVGRFDATDYR